MGLETPVNFISDLVPTNPGSADPKSQGDDHIRAIKAAIKGTFPNVAGAITKSHSELNSVTDRGLIGGQTWAGTHNFPATTYGVTAPPGSNGTAYATIDYVNAVAMSTVIPGQAGKNGCSLWSDGATASWARRRVPQVIVFTSSQTWSPPVDCWAEVIVQGGGAGGPGGTNSQPGGPGGGTAIKWLQLYAANTYTITVGAGGASQSIGVANAGGASSFAGPGITTILANGGPSVGPGGGPGGTASGGDINITGGPANAGTSGADANFNSGASHFSPGTVPYANGSNYGAGGGTTYGQTTSTAGYQGVVVVKF